MTDEQKRIAIAEACGWRFWQNPYKVWVATRPDGREAAMPGTPEDAIALGDLLARFGLPDYLNDLNAMREAEKTLSTKRPLHKAPSVAEFSDIERYILKLEELAFNRDASFIRHEAACATARQRADAFLMTIGKL